MKATKQFMMVFRFTPNFESQPTEVEITQMQEHWGSFIGNIAIQEKLISTHQLGFEGNQIKADLSVSEGILISENKTLGGNMIIKANSLEEATTMAKDCPILKMGGIVEVRTITPMEQ